MVNIRKNIIMNNNQKIYYRSDGETINYIKEYDNNRKLIKTIYYHNDGKTIRNIDYHLFYKKLFLIYFMSFFIFCFLIFIYFLCIKYNKSKKKYPKFLNKKNNNLIEQSKKNVNLLKYKPEMKKLEYDKETKKLIKETIYYPGYGYSDYDGKIKFVTEYDKNTGKKRRNILLQIKVF